MHEIGPQSTNKLGKYHLLGELGRGGMAHVYLAAMSGPARFNKLVVVKEIQSSLAYEPEFVTMFLDEARLAARLNHPNVVQTNEVGQQERRFYMVMEHLEGQAFQAVLKRLGDGPEAPLTLAMKLRVMIDALAGLHHAHELTDYDGTPLNVVHRDVSPHNIFVTYSGQVKVLDFGIAKALDSVNETSTGVLKGKVAYMAPEHARECAIDRRADVYAAGILLWELATGKRMFGSISQLLILERLTQGKIRRPSEVKPDIDRRLEAIIMKALAFRPEHRHPTAAALAQELEDFLVAQGDHSNCRHVGEMMSTAFAAERRRLQQLIERQLTLMEEAKKSSVVPVPRFDPTASLSSSSEMTVPDAVAAVTGGDTGTVTIPRGLGRSEMPPGMTEAAVVRDNAATPPPRRRAWLPWFVAAAITTGGVAAVLVLANPGDNAAPPPTPTSAAAPASHALRIESTPAGAHVECEGQHIGDTPLEVRVAEGGQPCAYVLLLDGYAPHKVERGPITSSVTISANLLAVTTATSGSAAPSAAAPSPVQPRHGVTPRPPTRPKPRDDIRLKR